MAPNERERETRAIAETLRAERAAHGLTLRELSERIGLHEQTYLRYEKGTREIPASALILVADALGLPLSIIARRIQDRLDSPGSGESDG